MSKPSDTVTIKAASDLPYHYDVYLGQARIFGPASPGRCQEFVLDNYGMSCCKTCGKALTQQGTSYCKPCGFEKFMKVKTQKD